MKIGVKIPDGYKAIQLTILENIDSDDLVFTPLCGVTTQRHARDHFAPTDLAIVVERVEVWSHCTADDIIRCLPIAFGGKGELVVEARFRNFMCDAWNNDSLSGFRGSDFFDSDGNLWRMCEVKRL